MPGDDELRKLSIFAADKEADFELFSSAENLVAPREKGKWIEFDLEGKVETNAIRLSPEFQGWGHQWGEVEFWVVDDGKFQTSIKWFIPQ